MNDEITADPRLKFMNLPMNQVIGSLMQAANINAEDLRDQTKKLAGYLTVAMGETNPVRFSLICFIAAGDVLMKHVNFEQDVDLEDDG